MYSACFSCNYPGAANKKRVKRSIILLLDNQHLSSSVDTWLFFRCLIVSDEPFSLACLLSSYLFLLPSLVKMNYFWDEASYINKA
jgi:hypothetical protein